MTRSTTATCQKCGKTWGGFKPEHCGGGTGCHETFGSTIAGDLHRTGEHAISTGPDRRRCRDRAEMIEAGLHQDSKGIWRQNGRNPWGRADGD